MIIIAKDEQELKELKDKTAKLRVIALDEIGLNPLDMDKLNRRQKDKILKRIEEMWNEEDKTSLFNEIVTKTLFDKPDMTVLPVNSTTYAPDEDKEHIPWK